MKKALGTRQKYFQVKKKKILAERTFLSQLYNVWHWIGSFFDESLIADTLFTILYSLFFSFVLRSIIVTMLLARAI